MAVPGVRGIAARCAFCFDDVLTYLPAWRSGVGGFVSVRGLSLDEPCTLIVLNFFLWKKNGTVDICHSKWSSAVFAPTRSARRG